MPQLLETDKESTSDAQNSAVESEISYEGEAPFLCLFLHLAQNSFVNTLHDHHVKTHTVFCMDVPMEVIPAHPSETIEHLGESDSGQEGFMDVDTGQYFMHERSNPEEEDATRSFEIDSQEDKEQNSPSFMRGKPIEVPNILKERGAHTQKAKKQSQESSLRPKRTSDDGPRVKRYVLRDSDFADYVCLRTGLYHGFLFLLMPTASTCLQH
jgi:hypothetical protein